jgi:hypothetical protein
MVGNELGKSASPTVVDFDCDFFVNGCLVLVIAVNRHQTTSPPVPAIRLPPEFTDFLRRLFVTATIRRLAVEEVSNLFILRFLEITPVRVR